MLSSRLDNVEGELRSAALDKAISGHRWKDRVLGVSQTVELPLHLSWYATGNNVRSGGRCPGVCTGYASRVSIRSHGCAIQPRSDIQTCSPT